MSHIQSYRMQRIADQIQQELAQLIAQKAQDPRFHNISITGVTVSPDMKNAHIFISQLETTQVKQTLDALAKASGFFRYELAHSLNLRITPKLTFSYDNSLDRGRRLSDLINKT